MPKGITSFSFAKKKTPFQKHREEEEAKKRREDEEAARIYDEFVESFQVKETKKFVRGGVINPDENSKSENSHGSSKKPGSRYVPSFLPIGTVDSSSKDKDRDRDRDRERDRDRDRDRDRERDRERDRDKEDENKRREEESAMKEKDSVKKDKGKIRNIDFFMEELKREQELREQREQSRESRRTESKPSSRFDEISDDSIPILREIPSEDGDPLTTNLYVGNLAPQVDENFLLRTFGRFGPIASVKIMWPRTEEEKRRQRNCGFVAFMRRADAHDAKEEMNGIIIYEYELRIGWGKTVSLPSSALPAPPPGQMAVRPKDLDAKSVLAWSEPGMLSSLPMAGISGQNSEVVVTPNVPDIFVTFPEDPHQRHIIDTLAMFILDDGCTFEQLIMERGRNNPLFDFLFDLGSAEHTYYVWRVYSLAQGDTLQRWRTEPFIMITGSGRWIPPPVPSSETSSQSQSLTQREKPLQSTFAAGKSRRVDLDRSLTDVQRDEFEDMLRKLTLERSEVKQAMVFCLDNADAASEIVEVITEALTLVETPVATKVARLMLVSDVLHNSSAPVKNASAFRTFFQSRLPDIMESFNQLYLSIDGRITAEALKERVMKVLQVWADWFLFSENYIAGLKATFLRPPNPKITPFHLLLEDVEIENTEKGEGDKSSLLPSSDSFMQNAELAIGEDAAFRELSSLPLHELERRCKHNGLSSKGGKDVMVYRLLSLDEAEKTKNAIVDEGKGEVAAVMGSDEKGEKEMEEKAAMDKAQKWTGWRKASGGGGGGGGWVEVSREEEKLKKKTISLFGMSKSEAMDVKKDDGNDLLVKEVIGMEGDQGGEKKNGNTALLSSSSSSSTSMSFPLPSTLSLPSPDLKAFGMTNEKGMVNEGEGEKKMRIASKEKKQIVFPPSKWSMDEDEEEEEKEEDERFKEEEEEKDAFAKSKEEKGHALNLVYSSSDSDASPSERMKEEEEKRLKLQQLESAVMDYRESLSEKRKSNSFEFEVKVAAHRKKLEGGMEAGHWPLKSASEKGEKGDRREKGEREGRGGFKREKEGKGSDRAYAEKSERNEEKEIEKKGSSGSGKRGRNSSLSPRGRDRDKEREREKDKEKDSIRSRDRGRDKEKEKERERDGEKHRDVKRSDSQKEKGRDRERERDRERGEKERNRENDRHGRDYDKEKSREREKRSRRN